MLRPLVPQPLPEGEGASAILLMWALIPPWFPFPFTDENTKLREAPQPVSRGGSLAVRGPLTHRPVLSGPPEGEACMLSLSEQIASKWCHIVARSRPAADH